MVIYQALGERIRARRRQLRMTQEVLAAQLGVSRASVASIETGRQNVLVHHLCSIAAALGVAPAELLDQASEARGLQLPLPDDLKGAQREQITRLIEGARAEAPLSAGGKRGQKTR